MQAHTDDQADFYAEFCHAVRPHNSKPNCFTRDGVELSLTLTFNKQGCQFELYPQQDRSLTEQEMFVIDRLIELADKYKVEIRTPYLSRPLVHGLTRGQTQTLRSTLCDKGFSLRDGKIYSYTPKYFC